MITIIGAGVVGCAIAQKLASNGFDVWILEAEKKAATGITSRNSGVIHAGLYYDSNWLKTKLCIRGSKLLYSWCQEHKVAHNKCGKLVIGNEESINSLYKTASLNGVEDLKIINKKELINREPNVAGECALWSPNTGIVDAEAFTHSLMVSAMCGGATIVYDAKVNNIEKNNSGWKVDTTRGAIECDWLINSAGLFADEVAQFCNIASPKIIPVRGNYLRWHRPPKFKHLIYPTVIKSSGGLGVHVTLELDGGVRLGPDVQWNVTKTDYSPPINETEMINRFYESAKHMFPALSKKDLAWDSNGIRPKLRQQNESERDFHISIDAPRLINLIGIESPGLTASMAIADHVFELLEKYES